MDRLNLIVDVGIPELLTQLAGGERKRGQWISRMVEAMHEQADVALGSDVDVLRLGLGGLAGQVKGIDARVMRLEQTVSAMIADSHR